MFHGYSCETELGLRSLGHTSSREPTCGSRVQSRETLYYCSFGCFRQVVRRHIAPGVAMGGGASKSAQLYYADTLASSNAEIAKITAKLRYADTLASSNAEIAKIVQESASQTDRIPFYGTEPEDFREGEQVIVSFPGVHGYGWKKLTQVSSSKHTPFASSCIFLPDEETPGYGIHDIQRGKRCSCHFLYNGERVKWGCHWFSQWKEQTLRAHGRRCKLVVVTKKDGSLGRSQAGEVQFLEAEKIPYESITIEQFARRIFDRRDMRRRKSGLLRSNRLLRSDSEDELDSLQCGAIYLEVDSEEDEVDSEEDGLDKIQHNAI